MISRRSFLKLSGLTVGALGIGFGSGQLLSSGSGRRFSVHGFVPDDDRAVADLLRLFRADIPSGAGAPLIDADARWQGVIRSAMVGGTFSAGPLAGGGRVHIRMTRLGTPSKGDILIHDDQKRMYDPDGDFSLALHRLRGRLQSTEATYFLSAEYVDDAPLTGLLAGGRVVIIEDARGMVERIPIDGRTRRLDVRGPQGHTGITISDAGAHVHSASCRHELCRKAGTASRPGDVIACAPNRVFMHVERG
ncbi:MAG: NusG domain II-containing protein [Bacteroidetes bacterium]|nr:NusG domain II-containing protein [Bacteroidota bacterium]